MKLVFAGDTRDGEAEQKRSRKLTAKPKISLLLEPKKKDWWEDDVVVVAYNIPRVTARLEGLMGSNVVRLTDRVYMHQLRQNHEANCIAQLQERIEKRVEKEKERQNFLIFHGHYTPENCPDFLKVLHSVALTQEMERERNLIIQGKMPKIANDLANHPVFKTNQLTNEVIAKRRSKLKTNREKNAERLIRQGEKWERNRLLFEDLVKAKEMQRKAKEDEQLGLEDEYRNEDAVKGLDLLRIHDKNWKSCELDLKKFLESEHARMRQRLMRKSVQYSSDPKDVQNVSQARKKFRETEEKIRHCLEEQSVNRRRTHGNSFAGDNTPSKSVDQSEKEISPPPVEGLQEQSLDAFLPSEFGLGPNEDLSHIDIDSQAETAIDYKATLQKKMENDIKSSLILPKDQFDALHYEDPLIALLRNSENVHDLYRLARDVVTADGASVVVKVQELEVSPA